MSKRHLKPPGFGGGLNKLPKLEVTISEHSFPLSQNVQQRSSPRESAQNIWGDDNEDDLLLQASQACEQNSLLPDYSSWQHPTSTSTQALAPQKNAENAPQIIPENDIHMQSTSFESKIKETAHNVQNFQFKTPGSALKLKNCKERVSSPLRDFNVKENLLEDSFVMDNKREDAEHFYKKLLQVQEENAKLKSENGKLLEQALSKDGEVTILRGRLKCCQSAVDAARLDKLQTSEKMQVEWTEKLTAANKQVSSLRTQLDCKELEVARMRERCKMLESNRIKLTQGPSMQLNATLPSQRPTSSLQNDLISRSKAKTISASVQTERDFSLKLNPTFRSNSINPVKCILPLLLENEPEEQNIFQDLDAGYSQRRYNLVVLNDANIQRIGLGKKRFNIGAICKDMSVLATVKDWECLSEECQLKCLNILTQVKSFLSDVLNELEFASNKVTSAFQRELDDKYVKEIKRCESIDKQQLFCGKALFAEEQKISVRRSVGVAALLCSLRPELTRVVVSEGHIVRLAEKITALVAHLSCAVQYSGLLLSFVYLLESARGYGLSPLLRDIVLSRPAAPVVCWALGLLARGAAREEAFCSGDPGGNLKLDVDLGAIMFRKESCLLQVLMCQLEVCIKCQRRDGQLPSVVSLARDLVSFYRGLDALEMPWTRPSVDSRCKCSLRLVQVLIFSLQDCSLILDGNQTIEKQLEEDILTLCRCGISVIYLWMLRDFDLRLLDDYYGRFHIFVDICQRWRNKMCLDEIQGQVLTELHSLVQPIAEDLEEVSTNTKDVWMESFSQFSITD